MNFICDDKLNYRLSNTKQYNTFTNSIDIFIVKKKIQAIIFLRKIGFTKTIMNMLLKNRYVKEW